MASIGKKMEKLRIELGMTQQEMADDLGVSRACVAHYESGKNKVTKRTVNDLIRLYGISKEWLLNDEYKGNMFNVNEKWYEEILINKIKMLDMDKKKRVREFVATL